MAVDVYKNVECYQAGDTIEGQFFFYGFTQNTIKDCSLFFDTPKRIPDGLTITASCTNVNWVIAASGALLQSGGTLKSVTKQNDYQLNIIVSFPNTFTGYYSCVVPVTGLTITFS